MYSTTTSLLILFICWITLVIGNQFETDPSAQNYANSLLEYDPNDNEIDNDLANYLEKRSDRYAFGLGRRAYHYTSGVSGVKRLPIYNFGLGKRARPYSFGLGKRMIDNNDDDGNSLIETSGHKLEQIYGQPSSFPRNQRNRPYSFGLGKRSSSENNMMNAMERRIPQGNLYNFGLGKRFSSTSDNELNEQEHKINKRSIDRPIYLARKR